MVQGLSKRPAAFILSELRPEEREEGVAAMEPSRRGQGQVSQQGQPLGLGGDEPDVRGVAVQQLEGAKCIEANHLRGNGPLRVAVTGAGDGSQTSA